MTVNVAHLGLAIAASHVTPLASNFRPPSWPPPDDFSVVVGKNAEIISRYGDGTWDVSCWGKRARILNFGDGKQWKGSLVNSHANATLLRQIAAWWLYGPMAVRNTYTLAQRFYLIRSIFFLCSSRGIAASDLVRFPAIADEINANIAPSSGPDLLALLHGLFEQREELGFVLLDREGLTRLEAALPDHEPKQTAYIPPRIWAYQVNRLRLFLDDFYTHKENIEACFHFCLTAYAENCGSLAESCRVGRNSTWGPFWVNHEYNGERSGRTYYGPFSATARRFGIEELLQRWVGGSKEASEPELSIRAFAKYFSMVGYAGIGYLLNFTLMRIDEGWSLRSDCLEVEQDDRFGTFHILRGATSKNIDDDDARWPTSPSVKVAVDALSCVAKLRMICADSNPDVPTVASDIENPYLIVRPYEPWGPCNTNDLRRPLSVRPSPLTYAQVVESYPNLFEQEEIRIARPDIDIARFVTPTLCEKRFIVGEPWPLAWHQLRRTGAVNMQASGLVSDASLQYLLKHTSRAMSLYYGQGYSRVSCNRDAQTTYLRTMYEMLGKEISGLFTSRFISPHGEKRKSEILNLIDPSDAKKLTALAKNGQVSYRETLLGGCTKRGPCSYGGVDNIVHCAGDEGRPACADVLYDRERVAEIQQLSHVIQKQLTEAQIGSPYRESLESQKCAITKALNVILS